MRYFLRKQRVILWFILIPLSISLACSTLTGGSQPTGSQPADVTVEQDLTFGSGTFNLPDPQLGLSDLAGYKATLTLSFDGTRDGQPRKWSKTYVMLVSKEPAVRQLTVETTGVANAEPVFMAELDGVDYEVRGQNPCAASAVEQGYSLSDRLEPARFLDYVIGADAAGSETVNKVAADHYTFDQRAMGKQGPVQSTGELWVASTGGYVVKYLLTTKANADVFGNGTEGTLSWDYELTDVGKPVKIKLPADCPGGMVAAPQLPGATNVINTPGVLTYDTSTSLADAAAFYQDKIPGLGWKLRGQADVTDTKALMDYTQGDQDMSIFITADAGVTTVNILLGHVQK
jgi:hypothetical protein